jgi:hypothetical protein
VRLSVCGFLRKFENYNLLKMKQAFAFSTGWPVLFIRMEIHFCPTCGFILHCTVVKTIKCGFSHTVPSWGRR